MSAISLSIQSAEASPVTGIATKVCSACAEAKPLSAFNVRRALPDGLNRACRDCVNGRKWAKQAGITCWAPSKESCAKCCPRCEVVKSREHFSEANSTRDGMQVYCKECRSSDQKSNRDAANKRAEKYRKANREKCSQASMKCHKENKERIAELARIRYHKDPEKYRKRQAEWARNNPDKARAIRKAWRENNADRQSSYMKAYRQENPEKLKALDHARRARLLSAEGSYTAGEWLARKAEFGDCCAYCGIHESELAGNKIKTHRVLHADHLHPLSKGGTNDISNIVPACGKCNGSKNNKLLLDFLCTRIDSGFKREAV